MRRGLVFCALLLTVPGLARAAGEQGSEGSGASRRVGTARVVALAAAKAAERRSLPALERALNHGREVPVGPLTSSRVTLSRGALLKTPKLHIYRVLWDGQPVNAVMVKKGRQGFEHAGFTDVVWGSPHSSGPKMVVGSRFLFLGDGGQINGVQVGDGLKLVGQGKRLGNFAALVESTRGDRAQISNLTLATSAGQKDLQVVLTPLTAE